MAVGGIMRLIKNCARKLVHILADIFPKKKNLWVFGCWNGKIYADNPKYLFEYVNKNKPEISCVWITRNKEVYKMLTERGYTCYERYSVRGILAALRAEAAFITSNEPSDISPFVSRKKTKVIQLWHGIGGKAMRWQSLDDATLKRFASYTWMATSEAYIDIMHDATAAPKENFIITGYPRNDVFVNTPENSAVKKILDAHPATKYVLYMPTHRNFGTQNVKVDEFIQVDKVFRENNIVMVYKPHFHELKNVLHLESQFTNIILAKDQIVWGDVYSYIHYFDLLIGDYSSVSYDFLCAKKPIVMYVYDIEEYKKVDFGIQDSFESMPLGPFCYTWEETVNAILSISVNDTWYEQREKCRMLFHPYEDGNNSARVCAEVLKLCGKKGTAHAKR